MLSNQIIIYDLEMKTYQQLWQSITPLYEAGEAQAIVRNVLDVKYGMTLTDIICGKVNELSADEERKTGRNYQKIAKKANLYSMFWAKLTLQEEPSM